MCDGAEKLVEGGVHLRCQALLAVNGERHHYVVIQFWEVCGVHHEFLGMLVTEGTESTIDVIEVANSFGQSAHHLLAMGVKEGGSTGEVLVSKIDLRLR